MPNPATRTRIQFIADEWADLPLSVPADIDWHNTTTIEYADPAPPIRPRSSRPAEPFTPTPPAYDFESDPRNTYDH